MKLFSRTAKPKVLQGNMIAQKVGQRPGFLFVPPDALPPRLFLISFDEKEFQEKEYSDYQALLTFFSGQPAFAPLD